MGEGYISCVAIELQHDGVAVHGAKLIMVRVAPEVAKDPSKVTVIGRIEINCGRRRSAGAVCSTLSRHSGARPAIDGSCFNGEMRKWR